MTRNAIRRGEMIAMNSFHNAVPEVLEPQANHSQHARTNGNTGPVQDSLSIGSVIQPEFHPIDIIMSEEPKELVWGSYRLERLEHFCGALLVNNLLSDRPDGSRVLVLPSEDCESEGLEIVLTWMMWADEHPNQRLVPEDFFADGGPIFELCSTYRALEVFGRFQDSDAVQRYIEERISTVEFTVAELDEALGKLPLECYWAQLILKHIRGRLRYIQHNCREDGHCVCGCKDEHGKPTGTDCLLTWVRSDRELCQAVRLDPISPISSNNARASYCDTNTYALVEKWVHEIEDVKPFPAGSFPTEEDLVGDANHRPTLFREKGSFGERYSLVWFDDHGGHYVETIPDETSTILIDHINQTTENAGLSRATETSVVNREWLVSRGYRVPRSRAPRI